MKKLLALLFSLSLIISFFPTQKSVHAEEAVELNIMNWEDYIDAGDEEEGIPSVIDAFKQYYSEKHGVEVKVNYSTQGTCENMYSELKLNPNHYDLVCPSEYMILKMLAEDMLEPLKRNEQANVSVYDAGVSPYIANLFKNLSVNGKSLYDYAACYMWGTMGFVYNPEFVSEEDVKHWSAVWNSDYKNKCTIKDSVRDSYILAIGYVYQEQLNDLASDLADAKQDYLAGEITKEDYDQAVNDYNKAITDIFNNVGEDSITMVGEALKSLNDSLYGYEVDSGKKDMAAGKIWINFAWSGDAVYALDFAEDPAEVGANTAELYYAVPEEGSNIFFDAWVMPKGADVELAQEFINFIQSPEIALRNMNYIGYTTSIATDEIFDYLIGEEGYAYGGDDVTERDGKFFVEMENEDGSTEDVEVFAVDLSYLFGRADSNRAYVAYTDVLGRQFSAQYPDFDTVTRCTVMRNFTDEEIERLNVMWADSKEGSTGTRGLYVAILITAGALVLALAVIAIEKRGLFNRHGIKGYTVVKKEELNR